MGIKNFWKICDSLNIGKENMVLQSKPKNFTIFVDFSIIYSTYLSIICGNIQPLTLIIPRERLKLAKHMATLISNALKSSKAKHIYIVADSDSVMEAKLEETIKRSKASSRSMELAYRKILHSHVNSQHNNYFQSRSLNNKTYKSFRTGIARLYTDKSFRSLVAKETTILLKTSLVTSIKYEAEILASALANQLHKDRVSHKRSKSIKTLKKMYENEVEDICIEMCGEEECTGKCEKKIKALYKEMKTEIKKIKKKKYECIHAVATRDTDVFVAQAPLVYMLSISKDIYNRRIFKPKLIKKAIKIYFEENNILYTDEDDQQYEINVSDDLIRALFIKAGCDFFPGVSRFNIKNELNKLQYCSVDLYCKEIREFMILFDTNLIPVIDNIFTDEETGLLISYPNSPITIIPYNKLGSHTKTNNTFKKMDLEV